MKYRQEVLNVILAQLLQEQGLVVAPEQILKISVKKARRMPDVILDLQGLRLAIEGEYGLNNLAKEKAIKSALGRVEEGIAHIGVAIVYPKALRSTDFKKLKEEMASVKFEYSIATEAEQKPAEQMFFDFEEKKEIQFN